MEFVVINCILYIYFVVLHFLINIEHCIADLKPRLHCQCKFIFIGTVPLFHFHSCMIEQSVNSPTA